MRRRFPLRAVLTAAATALVTAASLGATATSARASTSPGSRPLPCDVFSPYFETYDATEGGLAALSQASGARYLALAFLQTAHPVRARRTGTATPTSRSPARPSVRTSRRSRPAAATSSPPSAAIADTTGTELADSCTSVAAIAKVYESLVTTYGSRAPHRPRRRSRLHQQRRRDRPPQQGHRQGAALGRAHRRGSAVLLHTAHDHDRAGARVLALLQNAVGNGARVDVVNIMTFDYWDGAVHDMAADTETAAAGLHGQLQASSTRDASPAKLWHMVGVTEMPGIDDFGPDETFTQATRSPSRTGPPPRGQHAFLLGTPARQRRLRGHQRRRHLLRHGPGHLGLQPHVRAVHPLVAGPPPPVPGAAAWWQHGTSPADSRRTGGRRTLVPRTSEDPRGEHRPLRLGHRRAGSSRAPVQRADHFIFELIQNAEDAGATALSFELFGDRLEVRHDGRPFTEADVRGICGVAKSRKAGDLTQIGQFGIGFKSVYAYTTTPRVHSGAEHFRIDHYVRPSPAEPMENPSGAGREPGEGLPRPRVHLPVRPRHRARGHRRRGNLGRPEPDRARDPAVPAEHHPAAGPRRPDHRHGHRAADAAACPRVCGPGGPAHHAHPAPRPRPGPAASRAEDWFVWDRPLDDLGHAGQRVELAFRADTAHGTPRLVPRDSSPLVVFFPTQKETFLGFLIQGPYRTTPARDNVPGDDPANQALVGATAALLVCVIRELRTSGLLTVEVLAALPLDPARFAPGSMLRPLFDAVRTALTEEDLIPAAGGGYAAARNLKLASPADLGELLSPRQLGALFQTDHPLAFAQLPRNENQSPVLTRYLREEIGVGEVTPADLLARATSGFLEAQPDEWITRFYGFLYSDPALWREPRNPGEPEAPARTRPIIRLEDGRQVAAFDSAGRPAAYLPADYEPGPAGTGFPTVRRAVADAPVARAFLEALKFTEPDIVTEVLEIILPRYARGGEDSGDGPLAVAALDPAQHAADLECIMRALDEADAARRQRLLEQLQQTAFLIAENAATGEQRLLPPPALYQRSRDLEIYLDGNPDAWFAGDTYGPWLAQLRGMGVRDQVEVQARAPGPLGHVLLVAGFAHHERGLDGFDPEARIYGLEFALQHSGPARAEYVWNVLLAPNRRLVGGVVEKSVREQFADSTRGERPVVDRAGRGGRSLAPRPGRELSPARRPVAR